MDRCGGDAVIDYPNDRAIAAAAAKHGIPAPVLIRDLVRVVEVLNLKNQDFFSARSVLAGSMGLRCFDSPRFTVYDADFSTSSDTINPPTAMKTKLAYSDDELEIAPADLVPHDQVGLVTVGREIDVEGVVATAMRLDAGAADHDELHAVIDQSL